MLTVEDQNRITGLYQRVEVLGDVDGHPDTAMRGGIVRHRKRAVHRNAPVEVDGVVQEAERSLLPPFVEPFHGVDAGWRDGFAAPALLAPVLAAPSRDVRDEERRPVRVP